MNEQQLNDFLGDNEDKHLGTGWWANVLSAFFGALAFGGVLCLYFPQLLTTPELRAHYPVAIIRLLIQGLIWSSLLFGTIGSLLRKKKVLALCPATEAPRYLAIPLVAQSIASLPILIQFFLAVIVADIAEWTIHFALHKIPFLWRFHSIHHSSKELDWIAGSRSHVVDDI